MIVQDKLIQVYMSIAESFSELSPSRRSKVGCLIVKDDNIISFGYNGTPKKWDNNCEIEYADGTLVTMDEVLHAESNAITKLAKSTLSSDNAIMFCTHSPCIHCAKLIHQANISSYYYRNEYRDAAGLEFLNKVGVIVKKV